MKKWGYSQTPPNTGPPLGKPWEPKSCSVSTTGGKQTVPHVRTPYEESGWSDLCARKREGKDDIMEMLNSDNETPEERVEKRRSLDTRHELQEKYDEEDTAMLTAVIRIRKSMWT